MTFDYESQPKEQVSTCNLCGSHAIITERTGPDRYGIPVQMMTCQICGLQFLNPRMTREAYAQFYANGTYRDLLSEFYGAPITAESIEEGQELYAAVLSDIFEPFLRDEWATTLLDVGGSTGVVAKQLAVDHNLSATVLEPSEDEAKRAMGRGLPVLMGTVEDLEPPCASFDVITLCQTVDHLTDISGALRTIRAMLSESGLFFVDIVENGPVKVDHPYYLSRKTMSDYLRRTGFRVVYSGESGDGLHMNFMAMRA